MQNLRGALDSSQFEVLALLSVELDQKEGCLSLCIHNGCCLSGLFFFHRYRFLYVRDSAAATALQEGMSVRL